MTLSNVKVVWKGELLGSLTVITKKFNPLGWLLLMCDILVCIVREEPTGINLPLMGRRGGGN